MSNRVDVELLRNGIDVKVVDYPSAEYNRYKSLLVALYKNCEPDEGDFTPMLKGSKVVLLLLNETCIGFLVVTDTSLLRADPEYFAKGGLEDQGWFLTSLCGDSRYKGVAKKLIDYLVRSTYDHGYILLHVSKTRPWIKSLYEKLGFGVVGELPEFDIMRRDLQKGGGESLDVAELKTLVKYAKDLIKKKGIPFYLKKWKPYKMKPLSKYKTRDEFNVDLQRFMKSYHHHSFIEYKNKYIRLESPENMKLTKADRLFKAQLPEEDFPMPEFKWLEGKKIGYVRFYHCFTNMIEVDGKGYEYTPLVKKRLKSFINVTHKHISGFIKNKNIRGIILDFRFHVGGNVVVLYEALSGLLGDTSIYAWKNTPAKRKDKVWVNTTKNELGMFEDQPFKSASLATQLPIAVLIGPYTASAGEFGALMFSGRVGTRFFGSPSAGFLSGNEVYIKNDYEFVITDGLVTTVDGVFHSDERITPDVITKTPEKAAVKWILNYSGDSSEN